MATLTINPVNKPGPYTASIKAVGETTERVISLVDTTVTFTESPSTKSYVLSLTDANGKTHVTSFSLNCTPALANCGSGPTLVQVKNPTKNDLSFVHTSAGVEVIAWRIFLGTIQMLNGLINNTVNELKITFSSPLPDGTYKLEIEGSSCKSSGVSSLDFTISDASIPLAYSSGYPKAISDSTNSIAIAINKTMSALTIIKNIDTNTVIINTNMDYVAGQVLQIVRQAFIAGNYQVTVGGIVANLVMGNSLPNCERGPTLIRLTSYSRTAAEINFDALGVTPLRWRIRQGDTIIEDHIITPTNAYPNVTFASLLNGTYTMGIKGVACASDWSEVNFTIACAALTISNVYVEIIDGKYRLAVIYTGGTPTYTVKVSKVDGSLIAQLAGASGNPVYITLPNGTLPQTVKVLLQDINGASDEETAVLTDTTVSDYMTVYFTDI